MPAPRTQLQVSIRLATVDDDVERLQKIISTAFSSNKHWFNQSDIVKDERITTEELCAIIKAGVHPLVVAEVNGVVVGCLQIQHSRDHPDLDLPQGVAILGMLAIYHKYGSMGLGGRLARTALALAVRQGCQKGLIFVLNKRKDLQQKYKRNGFKWNGETREFRVASGKVLQPDVWYLVYERDISLLEVSLIRLGVLDFWVF